jgi:hypothetical protein
MESIKKYFDGWTKSRIIRLVLAIALGIGYVSSKETIYLFGAIILGFQAILNISCPGGACETGVSKNQEPIVKVDKFEPGKE